MWKFSPDFEFDYRQLISLSLKIALGLSSTDINGDVKLVGV